MSDTEFTECNAPSSAGLVRSPEEISSPEKPRGAEPGDVLGYGQGSPNMKICFDRFVEAKNSTLCKDKDSENIRPFSAFLPSGYLSPIKKSSSSSFLSSCDSVSITNYSESTSGCKSSNTIRIHENILPNLPYSPVVNQQKLSTPRMSALREVTEPLSSTFKTSLVTGKEEATVRRESEFVEISGTSKGKSLDTIFNTPKCSSLYRTYNLSRRSTRLLWSPFISCDDESSDEDHLECPPEKPPPPIMCMWRSREKEIEHEMSMLNMPMESIEPGRGLDTADKSTQTFLEPEALPLYYSPRGDPDAHRLKDWIDKIFGNKLADPNS